MPDDRKFNRLLREHGEERSSSLGEGVLPFEDATLGDTVYEDEFEEGVLKLLKGGKPKLVLRGRRSNFVVRTRDHEFTFPLFQDSEGRSANLTVEDLKSGDSEWWRLTPDGYEGPF